MILHTPDNNELMRVSRIERQGDDLVVYGVIMGSMPTKAVIHPAQLRSLFSLLNAKLLWNGFLLLFKK